MSMLATAPGSRALSNPRYEAFAHARARGAGWARAAQAGGFKGKSHQSGMRIGNRPEVKARIEYLRAEVELHALKLEQVRKRASENNPKPGVETEEYLVATAIAALSICLARGDIKGLVKQQEFIAKIRGVNRQRVKEPTKAQKEAAVVARQLPALPPTPPAGAPDPADPTLPGPIEIDLDALSAQLDEGV